MKLTNNQIRLALIFSLSLIGIWIVHLLTTQKDNFWNLSGLLIGVIALFFTIEERRNKMIVDTYDNISQSIKEVKSQILSEMERKDFTHDQQLVKLETSISVAGMRLELHTEEMGHKKMLEQMFELKRDMGDLSAHMAMLTEQGRVTHQLDQAKLDIVRLEAIVQTLRQELDAPRIIS